MIVVYSIIWVIIGGIIIAVSVGGAILGSVYSFQPGYLGSPYSPYGALGSSIVGVIGAIIGLFIIIFGVTASLLKVQTDMTADEVEKRVRHPA